MSTRNSVIKGMVFGGVLGVAFTLFPLIPLTVSTGTVLGALFGGTIGWFIRMQVKQPQRTIVKKPMEDDKHSVKILLREEALDISKQLIETGGVTMHKEIIHEEKVLTVPVTREELVIEKKKFSLKEPNASGGKSEIIRIPLSEEKIKVSKHTVVLNNISAYRHKVTKTVDIDDVLKKEKLHVDVTGNPVIIENKEANTFLNPQKGDLH